MKHNLTLLCAAFNLLLVTSCNPVSAPEPGPEPATKPTTATPAGTEEDPFIGRGIVREVGDDGVLTIEHEEIRGFMAAMTMPFPVVDEALLESVAVGDEIIFSIEVLADDERLRLERGYHIFSIEKTDGEDALGEDTAADSDSKEGPMG